jgi:hypothetical protein
LRNRVKAIAVDRVQPFKPDEPLVDVDLRRKAAHLVCDQGPGLFGEVIVERERGAVQTTRQCVREVRSSDPGYLAAASISKTAAASWRAVDTSNIWVQWGRYSSTTLSVVDHMDCCSGLIQ